MTSTPQHQIPFISKLLASRGQTASLILIAIKMFSFKMGLRSLTIFRTILIKTCRLVTSLSLVGNRTLAMNFLLIRVAAVQNFRSPESQRLPTYIELHLTDNSRTRYPNNVV